MAKRLDASSELDLSPENSRMLGGDMETENNANGSSRNQKEDMVEDKFRRKRKLGLKMMGRFGFIGTIASAAVFIIGVVGVALFSEEGKAPYVIPIGIIAGILSLIPSAMGMSLRKKGLAFERRGEKSRADVPVFVRCKILIIFVFAVLNFTLLFFCAFGGFMGMGLCISDDKNCDEDHSEKLALSTVVAVLCVFLWITCFFFTFWFCLYGRAFGFRSSRERDRNMLAMESRLRQQQQEIAYLQSQVNSQHQTQY